MIFSEREHSTDGKNLSPQKAEGRPSQVEETVKCKGLEVGKKKCVKGLKQMPAGISLENNTENGLR